MYKLFIIVPYYIAYHIQGLVKYGGGGGALLPIIVELNYFFEA